MKAINRIRQRSAVPDEILDATWGKYAATVKQDGGKRTTASVQNVIKTIKEEKGEEAARKQFTGLTRKAVADFAKDQGDMQTKTMNIGEVDSATPIVFDPEIVSILKQNAPLLDVLPEEGQEGFKAEYNVIDSREAAYGYISEGDAVDLTNNSPNDITFTQEQEDMTLYVDQVEISDFTQEAASHYMNVEETTLGERVGLHAQNKAQQVFYGDPSQGTGTGGLGDSNGFRGLTKFAELPSSSNVIDKSGVSSGFVKDIKGVVRDMRQEENVNVNNLVIMTSHEFYDVLENEADFDNLTTDAGTDTLNVGLSDGGLSIGGVPVFPTHNIDSFSDASYTPGDPGDVFIFSTRTARFRSLMPMSMVPLAKNGLAETVALAEFGALVEKSRGNFVRHLQAYNF